MRFRRPAFPRPSKNRAFAVMTVEEAQAWHRTALAAKAASQESRAYKRTVHLEDDHEDAEAPPTPLHNAFPLRVLHKHDAQREVVVELAHDELSFDAA